jgi:hypothetical protein
MMVLQVFLFSYRGNITLFSARFKTLGPFPWQWQKIQESV